MGKRKVEIEISAKDKASKVLKSLGTGALAGIGVAAGLAATQLAQRLGQELVRTAALIVNIGAGFEKSMSGVQAITRGTASEMAALEKVARNLGKSTVFTANNAAEAMEKFSLAGFSVNETLMATPAALDLAAAGELSMAEAADITANALRQFNLDAEETTRVVDVLAGAATTSNQTVRDIGEAMKFAGVTANALGVTLEETAALLGKLADRGMKASMGGTALRRSFAVFMGQLEPGEEGLKGFNAALATNKDGSFSFAKALEQLRFSGIKSGEVMKAFGQRAGPAMVALLGLGSGEIAAYTEEIRNMGGVAKQVGEDRLDNFTGDVTKLTSALTESALLIFDEAAPALRALAQDALGAVTAINNVWQSFVDVRQAIIDSGKTLDELEWENATTDVEKYRIKLRMLQQEMKRNEDSADALGVKTRQGGTNALLASQKIDDLRSANKLLETQIYDLVDARAASIERTKEETEESKRLTEQLEAEAEAREKAEKKAKASLDAKFKDPFDTSDDPFSTSQGPGQSAFIGPEADGGDDGGLQAGITALTEAEKLKRKQIQQTVDAVLSAALAIAASENEAYAIRLAQEEERFAKAQEDMAGNNEALENLKTEHELRKQEIGEEFHESNLEIAEQRLEEALAIEQERFDAEMERLAGQLDAQWELWKAHQARVDELKERSAEGEKKLGDLSVKDQKKALKEQAKATGATLAELFGMQKEFATVMTIINTAQAIMEASKMVWPLNIAMMALMAAEGAAQIAIINGAKFAQGGMVHGGVPGVDSVPALLQQGEYVLSAPIVSELQRMGVPATSASDGTASIGGGSFSGQSDSGPSIGSIVINVGGVESEGEGILDGDTIRQITEQITEHVKLGGGELVASHILDGGTAATPTDLRS